MKTVFLIVILLTWGYIVTEQSVSQNEDNLYVAALDACLSGISSQTGSSDSNSMSIVVEENIRIIDALPQQLGQFRIEYLDTEELKSKYKHEGRFAVLHILPIQVRGSSLKVSILKYWFSMQRSVLKRSRLNYALEAGCRAQFHFNSDEQKFELGEASWQGN